MISRILSVLAGLGLLASGAAKVVPAAKARKSSQQTSRASVGLLGICTDGQPYPPPPGCSAHPSGPPSMSIIFLDTNGQRVLLSQCNWGAGKDKRSSPPALSSQGIWRYWS